MVLWHKCLQVWVDVEAGPCESDHPRDQQVLPLWHWTGITSVRSARRHFNVVAEMDYDRKLVRAGDVVVVPTFSFSRIELPLSCGTSTFLWHKYLLMAPVLSCGTRPS